MLPTPRVRTRAVVKVQDGCDQFCAYCVVPYARKRKQSRPIEDVMEELGSLAEFGYKEVVLTGIRLGSYRDGNVDLPGLVRRAREVDGIARVRLSSVEPWEVDDRLLDAMEHSKVCRHLHIPLQSGDDAILRAMNRPYDVRHYRGMISRVRNRIRGIGVTTDVIVGFPGETEEAFANTREMIEEVGFSRLHVFRYSPRKLTRAAGLPNQVPPEVKQARAAELIELGKRSVRRFAESLIGETVEVLAENRLKASNALVGYADNYAEVSFPGDARLKGSMVRVRITGVDQNGRAAGLAEGRGDS